MTDKPQEHEDHHPDTGDAQHPIPRDAGVPAPAEPVASATTVQTQSDEDRKHAYFASAPLRSANRLMDLLYKDDSFYETTRFAWVGPEDAKKLLLYGVCKEVLKASIGMLEDKEHLKAPPEGSKPTTRLEKIILGAFLDTQTQRMRKLVELLSTLILFDRRAQRDEEYRIFLNAESLDLSLSRLEDFREVYDGRLIANTEHSVNDFTDRIDRDLKTLGVSTVWFLKMDVLRRQRPGIFESRKRQYLDALLLASPDERLALGVSYGRGYSSHSQAVHPLLGGHDYGEEENSLARLAAGYAQTGIIAMHIMRLAYKLAGHDDPQGLDKVMGKNLEKSAAKNIIGGMARAVEVGDLILTAWTDLAEVLEVYVGKYGYRACRIKYVSRPPLPETPEDWIESQRILIRLMSRSQMRAILEKAATSDGSPQELRDIMPEVLKQSDDKLMESARDLFLRLHEANALIPMLIQQGHLKRPEP